MNVLPILGKKNIFLLKYRMIHCEFSLGGGTCYDLLNAFACFCPDRIFRPQCNATSSLPTVRGTSVLMATSQRK